MQPLTAHDFEAHRNRPDVRRAVATVYERTRYWFYGQVTRVGSYGFQVASRPGVWLNWHTHAAYKRVEIGTEYRVTVDGNGRVHSVVEVLEDSGETIPF